MLFLILYRRTRVTLAAAITLLSSLSLASVEKAPIVLGQGEQRLLKIPQLSKYSLGNSTVKVVPIHERFGRTSISDANALLIKGVSPGSGDLWIWKRDGSSEYRTIRVERYKHQMKNAELEQALGKLDETEIVYSSKGTILRGQIHSLLETAKISAVMRGFSSQVFDETTLSEELLEEGLKALSKWLRSSGYSETVRVEKSGQSLWIRGHLNRPSEKLNIEKHVYALFPLVKTEIECLPDYSPTVHFRVFLLELKKTRFSGLGLSLPSAVPGAFKITSGTITEPFKIDFAIKQLEGTGDVKILSNPELVVRAPGQAELFAGGEIPLRTVGLNQSSVTWRKFGLTLKLNVTHTSGDKVRLEIFTEVSHLDTQVAQDSIPGIQANRMTTQVDARFGYPLFLSGLLQQNTREEAKGLPILRNIPILGQLFGSSDYMNEKSELVAILYPHATPPPAPKEPQHHLIPRGALPLPRNWIAPENESEIRESPEFPWNVLE